MFLPLDKKPDWHHPPLITLILVLANVLVFYLLQYGDESYEQEAFRYYTESGLIKSEIKAYLAYKNTPQRLSQLDIDRGTHSAFQVFEELYKDAAFQESLQNNKVIKPDDIGFNDWRSHRDHYLRLKQRSVTERYGLDASQPELLTLFTNMFLHGNDGHLWSNMIMLLLLGLGLEVLLGRWLYLAGYLLSGMGAGVLYVLFYHQQAVVTVGASGAIAGVLGMAVMFYGLRKINFFYFLFVYFDYIKARAVWIIPLYILSQLIIEFVFDTNVNVAAHIGGFVSGLCFVGLLKLIPNVIRTEQHDAEQISMQYKNAISEIQQLIAQMKIDEAKTKLNLLQQQFPDDATINQLMFSIARHNPASDEYHNLAHSLLTLPGNDRATVNVIYDTFVEYASKAKPKPRWTPELMMSMAIRFAPNGHLEEAEQLVNHLVNALPDFHRNAEGIFALAKNYNGKDKQKAQHYRDRLLQLYPDSIEAKQMTQNSRQA